MERLTIDPTAGPFSYLFLSFDTFIGLCGRFMVSFYRFIGLVWQEAPHYRPHCRSLFISIHLFWQMHRSLLTKCVNSAARSTSSKPQSVDLQQICESARIRVSPATLWDWAGGRLWCVGGNQIVCIFFVCCVIECICRYSNVCVLRDVVHMQI